VFLPPPQEDCPLPTYIPQVPPHSGGLPDHTPVYVREEGKMLVCGGRRPPTTGVESVEATGYEATLPAGYPD